MYSYLKYLLFILLLLFGFIPKGFSYFDGKLYCDITKDRIVISLDNKKFYTCDVYVRYFETQMKSVYKDILLIQKYIDKKEDLGYWKPLKEDKVSHLKLLQNMRLNILSHMKTFESNLLETSKSYFLVSIDSYKKKLINSFKVFSALKDSSAIKYSLLLKQQFDNIDKISKATNFKELNSYIEDYVYFKKQIEGK